jgi:hypothetical protein
VVDVLADGRVAASMSASGVIVHELTTEDVAAEREVRHYPGSDSLDVLVPWDQVVGWRVVCECGWAGVERPAVGQAGGSRDCPEEVEERVFYPAWAAHVAPYTALTDLERLTGQARDLEARIGETVRLARRGGASWAQVGRAAGLSKQGAQQRWGHPTPAAGQQ